MGCTPAKEEKNESTIVKKDEPKSNTLRNFSELDKLEIKPGQFIVEGNTKVHEVYNFVLELGKGKCKKLKSRRIWDSLQSSA
jgi:hypothetical protein